MNTKIKKGIKYIFSIPKTIYFNFRIFPLKIAIKLPVLIANTVKCDEVFRGCFKIEGKIKPFMIAIGVGGSKAVQSKKGLIHIAKKNNASITFKGRAHFGEGCVIFVNHGNIIFGNNFSANRNCFISSDNNMTFGNDVLIGWNVNIRDSDGHTILYKGDVPEKDSSVQIGNHVWICAHADILKGSKIGNDCVVAYRSCVIGLQAKNNTLIGGYPAKALKENINWKK